MAFAVPCSAQETPLLTGAVRDQTGEPVAGATVRALAVDGSSAGSDRTDEGGTFALALRAPARELQIGCRYCVTARLPVKGRTVVAIVRRYRALVLEGPDQRDLAALPYARLEDAVALRPFAMVNASDRVGALFGAQLSDRGLASGQALLLDGGASNYDIVGGATPSGDFPLRYASAVIVAPPSKAFRYGNYANGGSLFLDALGEANRGVALLGNDDVLRADFARGRLEVAGGMSRDIFEDRARGDADLSFQTRRGTGDVWGAVFDGSASGARGTRLERSGTLTRARYAESRPAFEATLDVSQAAGRYVYRSFAFDTETAWSDGALSLRLQGRGPGRVAGGALFARSSGFFRPNAGTRSTFLVAGTVAQELIYAEASAGRAIEATAGLAAAHVRVYGDRPGLAASATDVSLLVPSLRLSTPSGNVVALEAAVSQGFHTPTLIERFSSPYTEPDAAVESTRLMELNLHARDDRRFRADATLFRERTDGAPPREQTGLGFSSTWQATPLIAVRVWSLHVTANQENAPYNFLPLGESPSRRSVGWLTYENRARVRSDIVYQRETFANGPRGRLDYSASVPTSRKASAYFASEFRDGARRVSAGLRLEP